MCLQALRQVLKPLVAPTFSETVTGSVPVGWRTTRSRLRGAYVQTGKRVVVDGDLAKLFDRVNHDIPIERLRNRIDDAAVIRLVSAYLNAGIMDGGMVVEPTWARRKAGR